MTLYLHTAPSVKNIKSAKRVGRGLGSGKGKTSGRGVKGQKSRTGGRGGLKMLGMKRQIQSMPKLPGFRSLKAKREVVSLELIEKHYNAGEKVSVESLHRKGLIRVTGNGIKILGDGVLTKKLLFVVDAISGSAAKAIEASGSTVKICAVAAPRKKPVHA